MPFPIPWASSLPEQAGEDPQQSKGAKDALYKALLPLESSGGGRKPPGFPAGVGASGNVKTGENQAGKMTPF